MIRRLIVESMKRPGIQKAAAQYACNFRPEPEGGYTVTCPAFPELVTYGSSLKEARERVREAIELCLEVYRGEGRPFPPFDSVLHPTITEMVPVRLANV
jgi:antitoxin HicB